ncbi:O-acyltransferase like protein-like [Bacillus rossius redtenbacheri]|uniref:O-acyltransferase like protein-like n=1 Tax=Bacillus rossius redtenbacheri TaxID=93214 RepID=UPI002FDC85A5
MTPTCLWCCLAALVLTSTTSRDERNGSAAAAWWGRGDDPHDDEGNATLPVPPPPAPPVDECGADDWDAGASAALAARKWTTVLPPFSAAAGRGASRDCVEDSRTFLRELDKLSLWAVKMHDSSGKLPSGLLNGNVNQFGDYDQCVSAVSPGAAGKRGAVRGQYCLAYLQLQMAERADPRLHGLHQLLQSHWAFRSNMDDPGHRVPRYSTIHWALCVPHSCSAADVQASLEDLLQRHTRSTGVTFRARVDPEMCQVARGWDLPWSSIVVGLLFAAIVGVAAVATIWEYTTERQENEDRSTALELFQSFSLKRNLERLISLEQPANDIHCLHGIRFLNAYMLLKSHKSMAVFFIPYTNRTAMAEFVGKSWTGIVRAASLYTDPFIMMSGLLTSYSFFRQLQRNKSLSVYRQYTSRLFRLVPNLAALILFCTFLLPWLGSGPQWNLVVQHHSDICKANWWRNFLFIHNYYGFENMCLTHTHHLGIDAQLFFFSPLLVFLLWWKPQLGVPTLVALAATSTALRYQVSYAKQLSPYVYFGASVSELFNTANLSYIIPLHRATVYIMGILLGYVLQHVGTDFRMKKSHLICGWTFTAAMLYFSLVAPSKMGDRTYMYDPVDAANYAAFSPIAWCLVFSWVIFTSHTGNGGLIGKIFSSRGFLISTRLSYAFYLTQFPVFFYNVGTTRTAEYYTIGKMFEVLETGAIVAASVLLTVLVDMPFQNIRNTLLKTDK